MKRDYLFLSITASPYVLIVATATILIWPALQFAYRNPGLHILIGTVSALMAFAIFYLYRHRFLITGEYRSLFIALAYLSFATTNIVMRLGLTLFFGISKASLVHYAWLLSSGIAVGALLVGYLVGEKRATDSQVGRIAMIGTVSLLVLLTAASAILLLIQRRLPAVAASSLVPAPWPRLDNVASTLVFAEAALTIAIGIAAKAYLGIYLKQREPLLGWISLSLIITLFAHIHFLLYPPVNNSLVYTGDFLRLGSYLALFLGTYSEHNFLFGAVSGEKKKLSALIEGTGDGIYLIEDTQCMYLWNPALQKITGYNAEEVLGQDFSALLPELYPADEQLPVKKDIVLIGKNGKRIPVEIDLFKVAADSKHDWIAGIVRDLREKKNFERSREDFVAMLTHDLRTPLYVIKTLAETIITVGERLDDAARDKMLGSIAEEAARLSRLASGVATVTKTEDDQDSLDPPVPVNVGKLIQDTLQTYASVGLENRLGMELEPDLPEVAGSPDRLKQVLTNLLDNAIKNSLPEDKIVVSAQVTRFGSDASYLEISVKDEGFGMTDNRIQDLFEIARKRSEEDSGGKMHQGSLHVGGSQEGGLGLYICKRIVEAHGGCIWAESKEGKGSKFTFALPVQTSATTGQTNEGVETWTR